VGQVYLVKGGGRRGAVLFYQKTRTSFKPEETQSDPLKSTGEKRKLGLGESPEKGGGGGFCPLKFIMETACLEISSPEYLQKRRGGQGDKRSGANVDFK